MTIVNQLLQFYLPICMRIQLSIFVIILKASTSIVRSVVSFVLRSLRVETSPAFYGVDCLIAFYIERSFTEKFRRPTNRFLQGALYLLLLILIVDSYFLLFIGLCLSAQKCARLIEKILLGFGSSDTGMSSNIVPITLQLTLIGFFLNGVSSVFKDAG